MKVTKDKLGKRVSLDEKDKKLIMAFSHNVRTPLSQLAKKVGLSRDAVAHRIKKYEEVGIITGYRTVVDIARFDYINYHLFIKLDNPSDEVEKSIVKELKEIDQIRGLIKYSGNYDFEIALIAKSVKELEKLIWHIGKACMGELKSYHLVVVSDAYAVRSLPSKLNLKKEKNKNAFNKVKLNKVDIDILKKITLNARLSLVDIASFLKMSADAVAFRIRKMVDAGIILSFIPVIDYTLLGYTFHALLLSVARMDDKKEKMLKDFFMNDDNVIWSVKAIGSYNILVYVLAKEVEEFKRTTEGLRELFPGEINDYSTLIGFNSYKYTYFPSGLF